MKSLSLGAASPSDSDMRNRNRIGRSLVLALMALALATPAYAQFDSGESDPPPHPEPRFPQLPDDPPNIPPGPPRPLPARAERSSEIVGDIQKINNRKLTIQHNQTGEVYTVNVAPKATVVLNKKPATLDDLLAEDFVRVTLTQTTPDLITHRVIAARVIADTPPQPRPIPMRRSPVREAPTARPVDNAAGLGVTVGDSPEMGIMVVDVHEGTPAKAAGLRKGDYLLELEEKELKTPSDFLNELSRHQPKDSVRLVIWRNGKMRQGNVKLTTAEIAKDRVAVKEETKANDTTVIQSEKTIVTDGPDKGTVVVDEEPMKDVVDQNPAEEVVVPKDYETLEKDYRQLLKRVTELEQELKRLKNQ